MEKMLHDDSTVGQTFELYGPKNYSTAEIAELVDREIIKDRSRINVPKAVLKPVAYYLNKFLWWHTMSADEVEREHYDQVIDPEAKTFKDLGMNEPADLVDHLFHYLVCLRGSSPRRGTNTRTEKIPQLVLLRSPSADGEGAARGEEVPACAGRPVVCVFNVYISRSTIHFICLDNSSGFYHPSPE